MPLKKKILCIAMLFAIGGLIGSRWQAAYDSKYYNALLRQFEEKIRPKADYESAVSLMIDNSTDPPAVYSSDYLAKQTLYDFTKQLAEKNNFKFEFKDYGEMGYLITQIGDKINGTDNKFWQYWVNNEQVQVAANKYTIKPQDVIMWKFTASKF